jgi:hypothetical protein
MTRRRSRIFINGAEVNTGAMKTGGMYYVLLMIGDGINRQ